MFLSTLIRLLMALDRRSERGQSTAEYALVMVGVGALAVFVFKWLESSGLIEQLFGAVIRKLMPR
jgi:hypothetical protein